MIRKIFGFWKRTKQQKAIKLVLKLRETLFDLGYEKPDSNTASAITIWEFSNGQIQLTERKSNIEILCVEKKD